MAIKRLLTQIQCRNGVENDRINTIFAEGEPVYISDTKKMYIGDGITPGGIEIATADGGITRRANSTTYGMVKLSYEPGADGESVVISLNDPRIGLYSGHVSNTSGNPHGTTATMIGAQPSLGFVPENVSNKGTVNGYASLGEDGKVPLTQLPSLQQINANVSANEFNMLTSLAKKGDICIRTDISRTFILKMEPASEISNWIEILSPSSGEYPDILSELNDVNITAPIIEGSSLVYDLVTEKWINRKLTYQDVNAEPLLGYTPENSANKNIPYGYAGLDANGNIDLAAIPLAVDYIGYIPENSARKDTPGGYVGLDNNGKISSSMIPNFAITDTFVALSEYDMLNLPNANKGDVCIRPDQNKTYILKEDPSTVLTNWVELALTKTALALLSDTTLASVQDGQCLVYSAASNKWINRKLNIAEFGIPDIGLDCLNDTTITNPSNNQTLLYKLDTHEWINKTLLASDIGAEPAGSVSNHEIAYNHSKIHDKLTIEDNGLIVVPTDKINFISTDTISFNISSDLVGNKINIAADTNISEIIGPQGPQGANGVDGANGTNGLNGTDGVQGVQGAQGAQGPQGLPGETTIVGGSSSITRYAVGTSSNGGKSYVTATGVGATLTKVTGGAILEAPVGVEILSASIYFDENEATSTSIFINYGKSKGMGENTDYLNLYCPQYQVFQDVSGNRAMKAAVAGNLNNDSCVLTLSSLTAGQAIWINLNV